MDYGGGGSGTRGTKTYTVRGKTYRPYLSADGYREDGVASWYGRDFHGKTTANGERYNMYGDDRRAQTVAARDQGAGHAI